MFMKEDLLFNQVLFIGPDMNGRGGGIGSVLKSYSKTIEQFRYIKSNSRYGTIVGAFNLLILLLRMPIERFFKGAKIAHIHVATGKSFIRKTIIIYWAWILGYKVIYHCHGAETKTYFEQIGLDRAKRVLSKCARIVVLSKSWQDYFVKTFNRTDVDIINNIVDERIIKPNEVDGTLKFWFFGCIGDRKGLFDLLTVFAESQGEFRNKIHLYVGGTGEVDRLNKFLSDTGIDDMVTFLGFVNGNKKEEIISSCNVFALPSYNEGLPIAILEAMSAGKTVISTTVGGIPEVVINGVNGFVHEPGDRKSIYQAIKTLVDNPNLLQSYAQEALRIVKEYFPSSVKKQLLEVYKQI